MSDIKSMPLDELQKLRVTTPVGRASFPQLHEPDKFEQGNGDPKYSVKILIDKNDPTQMKELQEMQDLIEEVAIKAFGTTDGVNLPMRDGDDTEREEQKGMWCMTAKSQYRPDIVDGVNLNQVITDSPTEVKSAIYPGCHIKLRVNFYSYSRSGNKGVSAGLYAVCKTADDDSFLGKRDALAEFGLG